MSKFIKFTGKFKTLKPMGFEFNKYFARNHKGYAKKDDEWTTDMMIWVLGRNVTLSNLSHIESLYAAKYIINDKYPVYTEDYKFQHGDFIMEHKKGDPKSCMVNDYTGEVISYDKFIKYYDFKTAMEKGEPVNHYKDG